MYNLFVGFEQSPFKLTPEFVEIMGGPESELWIEFKSLLLQGLMAARKHMDRIINIVEIMRSSECFRKKQLSTVQKTQNIPSFQIHNCRASETVVRAPSAICANVST
jgi:phosphatidylinositol kinase/protein kinase (PI-3  family)